MPKIAPLSEETIGLIAAGEVIETPACALKELIENSIDAGALKLEIEIMGGGLQKIAVRDDGCGMAKEDAYLSIIRHATSKLIMASDLLRTKTLGFRGEALAAIAAVSEMQITSQEKGAATGVRLWIERGQVVREEVAAGSWGTSIEIYGLFDNTPVRRLFQPTEKTSENLCIRTIEALALSRPDVSFRLICDGKERLVLPATTLEGRLVDCGESKSDLMAIAVENSEGKITGFVSTPERTERGPSRRWLFINERFVSSQSIDELVRSSFGQAISEKKIPTFCLHATLPLDKVDINIHPKKKEVDYRLPASLGSLLHRAILKALAPKQAFSLPVKKDLPLHFEFSPVSQSPQEFESPSLFTQPQVNLFRAIGPYTLFEVEGKGTYICHRGRIAQAFLFEGFKKTTIESSALLNPLPLTFAVGDPIESPLLKSAGFSIRLSGPRTAIIEMAPSFLPLSLIEQAVHELLHVAKLKENIQHVTFLEKVARRLRKSPALALTCGELKVVLEEIFSSEDVVAGPLYAQAIRTLDEKQINQLF